MILVIDTSSAVAAIATLNDDRAEVFLPSRGEELRSTLRRLAQADVEKVAVVTGPGSFTGLRVGVSFALGLAMGRQIPIVPLPTLQVQAARSDAPLTAVADAGRGRFYFLLPDGRSGVGEPADIPATHPLVGRLTRADSLVAAGHRFKPENELRRFVDAAAKLLETAPEVPYRNLEISYMQTFSR